jgi:hypothetical protein
MSNTINGYITSVNVKGIRQNSAQLLFTVQNPQTNEKLAIMATPYPNYEPYVFASFTSLVAEAYFAHKRVAVGYQLVPGETSRVIEVEVRDSNCNT